MKVSVLLQKNLTLASTNPYYSGCIFFTSEKLSYGILAAKCLHFSQDGMEILQWDSDRILKFHDIFTFDTIKSCGKNIKLPLNKITEKLNGNNYVLMHKFPFLWLAVILYLKSVSLSNWFMYTFNEQINFAHGSFVRFLLCKNRTHSPT